MRIPCARSPRASRDRVPSEQITAAIFGLDVHSTSKVSRVCTNGQPFLTRLLQMFQRLTLQRCSAVNPSFRGGAGFSDTGKWISDRATT